MYEDAQRQLKLLSDDDIAKFVGKEKFESIRKNYLKQLKKEVPSVKDIKKSAAGETKNIDPFKKNKDTKRVNSKDFFKNLGKKAY